MPEMQSLTLNLFNKGLIISPALDLVPDEALIKTDGITFSQEGVVELSRGITLDGTTFGTAAKIHSLFKVDLESNTYTYAMATEGTSTQMFRKAGAGSYSRIDGSVSPALSSNRWTLARAKHVGGSKSWSFMVNGDADDKLKDDGTNLVIFGLDAPGTGMTGTVGNATAVTKKTIDLCDATTGWSGTGTNPFQTDAYIKKEGTASLFFQKDLSQYFAYITKATVLDLTDIGGTASDGKDHIHFWIRPNPTLPLSSIQVHFDCNNGNFDTDWFYYEIKNTDLDYDASAEYWQEFNVMKDEFTRVGSTGGKDWSTVQATRIYLWGYAPWFYTSIWIDEIYLKFDTGSSSRLFGTYDYRVTFYENVTKHESNPSAVDLANTQVSITEYDKKVTLNSIPTYGRWDSSDVTMYRRIYRKGGTLTDYRLVDTIEDNATTTYDDTTSDSALVTVLETDNDPPPNGSVIFEFQDYLFIAVDNWLYYSKRHEPESWPTTNYLVVGEGGEDITAGVVWGGVVFLFKQRAVYRLRGTDETDFVIDKLEGVPGTLTPYAVAASHRGIGYINHDGVYLFNGVSTKKISAQIDPMFHGITKNGILPVSGDATEIQAAFHDGHFFFSYPTGGTDVNGAILAYDPLFDRWHHKKWGSIASFASYEPSIQLLGGRDSDGKVLNLDVWNTYTDEGSALTFGIDTKYYDVKQAFNDKLLTHFEIDWESSDAGENLAGTLGLNNGASTVSLGNFSTASRTIDNKTLGPGTTAVGRNFNVRLSGSFTQKVTIYKMRLIFIPLPAGTLLLEFDWQDFEYYGIKFLREWRLDIESVSLASNALTVDTYADGDRSSTIDSRSITITTSRDNHRVNLPPELSGNIFKLVLTGAATGEFRLYKAEVVFIAVGKKGYERVQLR